jgi:hypothetical protein
MFISFLYVFRATVCPSSGETSVSMWHLVFVILCGWLSSLHTRQSSIQNNKYQVSNKRLWWSRGSVLPFKYPSSRVQTRPKPSGFFRAQKILSAPSFGGEVKPSVPCRRFAARKRSLNVTWKLAFRQNYRPTFSPTVPPFAARFSRVVWTWRCRAAEVGTSKIPRGGGTRFAQ